MSRSDSREPPKPATGGGARVIVHDRPARAPEQEEPEPPRRSQDAIIVPENQLAADRDAFIASLDAKWGALIEKELSRCKDVAKASRPDVHQAVLVVLSRHYEKERKAGKRGDPENVPAFLRDVTGKTARNHARKKQRRPRIDPGAEVGEAPDAGPDPEREAMLAEQREKLARYCKELTEEEAEVFEAREVDGMTFEVIATLLGRPLTTVYRQHRQALQTLRDLARASERGTEGKGGPAPVCT